MLYIDNSYYFEASHCIISRRYTLFSVVVFSKESYRQKYLNCWDGTRRRQNKGKLPKKTLYHGCDHDFKHSQSEENSHIHIEYSSLDVRTFLFAQIYKQHKSLGPEHLCVVEKESKQNKIEYLYVCCIVDVSMASKLKCTLRHHLVLRYGDFVK